MNKENMSGKELLKALEELKELVVCDQWCDAKVELPLTDEVVLAVVSLPKCSEFYGACTDSVMFAYFTPEDGWVLDDYPEWKEYEVKWWKPLPEVPGDSRKHVEEFFGGSEV